MAFIGVEIPDEVLKDIKEPNLSDIRAELKKELAFYLYDKEMISMGIARKISGLSKWEFLEGLSRRGIKRHYTEEDLIKDLEYADFS